MHPRSRAADGFHTWQDTLLSIACGDVDTVLSIFEVHNLRRKEKNDSELYAMTQTQLS